MSDITSWIIVYTVENGGRYHIETSHWDEIDAAFGQWIERRYDKVLCLTGYNGSDIRMPASRISDFSLCTADSRARMRELEAMEKAESGYVEE